MKELFIFLKKLNKIPPSKRKEYILQLSNNKVKYICEIVLNFLQSKVKVGFITLEKLRKFRSLLHDIVSKRKSIKVKKKLLTTLKGIFALKILLPYVLTTLYKIIRDEGISVSSNK